ncbi:UvrD-helicase domain-containing protein [Actinomadura sp. DC4]|uniref:UvrD-helicase domain-containing protein n=1 Tax=Actinomadura sp. DC4 TaxID=3055069 RepID=UPI0025B21A61|nr:UvrD-helicase domain-containing protein [Actinomadura sp. DC4]MDN3351883.1 AAA family ATPase [Actinomadura sp. DC4]
MAQLAIAKEFLAEYAKLEKPVQRAVQEAIEKFGRHTHAGLHLEPVTHARDPRIRTIRIAKFWRGVVLAPETGDLYCLLRVLPHDDAYAFAMSRRFTVNQTLGVLESRDESQLETLEPTLRKAAEIAPARLFDGFKDPDLKRLGIDEQVLPIIRLLTREAHLEALQHLLPTLQYDALLALASGMSIEEAWAEISKSLVDSTPPERVDPDDLGSAIARTPDQVTFVEGPDELTKMLDHPFDVWRVFLHPMQQKIARRESYSGPAMVSGGAGTGKTVTALHRAAHLADRRIAEPGASILLTTYTTSLAHALEQQLTLLIDDPELRDRVEVRNLDKVAAQIVRQAIGRQPTLVAAPRLRDSWETASRKLRLDHSGRFLVDEWEQVILAQGLTTEEAYLACSRAGRRERLGAAGRHAVWQAITTLTERMREADEWSFLQLVDEAARVLTDSGGHLYRHVIVDEAQDLHPVQWRLLRALVPRGPDDLFLVGDPHQRIYGHRVSLARLGIDVRGRSRRLTVSYRTTQEILTWAVHVLGLTPAAGLDDEPDGLEGYGSPMHGRRPAVRRFPDREAEIDALVAQVRAWLNDGVEARAIGIAARVNTLVKQVKDALSRVGITAVSTQATGEGVRVATMHAMKGLEFRCIAVTGVDEEIVPLPYAVTPAEDDRAAHEEDLQRERCLLFVACTRARDRLYVTHSGAPSPFLPR